MYILLIAPTNYLNKTTKRLPMQNIKNYNNCVITNISASLKIWETKQRDLWILAARSPHRRGVQLIEIIIPTILILYVSLLS